jgi:hypothetical protein
MDNILKELECEKDIIQMETIFKRNLSASSYTIEELKNLRNNPIIKRHVSLQYILEKAIENNDFKSTNANAKKESILKKIFIGIGFWP